jgi:poly-gamma-glutamate synthesis protein (capsule biosynthesis protein)
MVSEDSGGPWLSESELSLKEVVRSWILCLGPFKSETVGYLTWRVMAMIHDNTISLYAVGDVAVTRDNPESAFTDTAAVLNEPDILFGQLEATLSQKGKAKAEGGPQRPHPIVASVLKAAGFDVMSFASNHVMDYGAEGLLDTLNIASEKGITLFGAGKDIYAARQPAIIERKGVRIAFLGYNSILPKGFWATQDSAGCAPLRVRTFYESIDPHHPGTPPEVLTQAYEEDVEAMVEDIRNVRPLADVVVISMHWGIHHMAAKLAMYQQQAGHAAIDAGADLIIGSHPHILKGIEVYKGKVIFYSLGNFVMDSSLTKTWPDVPARWRKREILYNFKIDPEWGPTYPFPAEARKTILAKILVSNKGIESVSFVPGLIRKPNTPQLLSRSDETFYEVVKFLQWSCEDQNLQTKLFPEGDEVVVCI